MWWIPAWKEDSYFTYHCKLCAIVASRAKPETNIQQLALDLCFDHVSLVDANRHYTSLSYHVSRMMLDCQSCSSINSGDDRTRADTQAKSWSAAMHNYAIANRKVDATPTTLSSLFYSRLVAASRLNDFAGLCRWWFRAKLNWFVMCDGRVGLDRQADGSGVFNQPFSWPWTRRKSGRQNSPTSNKQWIAYIDYCGRAFELS